MYFLTGIFFAGKDGKNVLNYGRPMYSLTAFPFLPAIFPFNVSRYLFILPAGRKGKPPYSYQLINL